MENSIICPVCKISLPSGTMKCPDCGNDLSVFVYLQREADVLFNKALAQYQEGRADEALVTLNFLLQKYPDEVRAVNLLGKLYANQGRIEQAATLWQAAANRSPAEKTFQQNLSVLEVQQSRRMEAARAEQIQARRSARLGTALRTAGMFITALVVILVGQRLLAGAPEALPPAPTGAPVVMVITATSAPSIPSTRLPPTPTPTTAPTAIPTSRPSATPDLVPAAQALLAQNPRFQALNLTLTQKEGQVLAVSGEIHNVWERLEVESLLNRVEGVTSVDMKGLTFGKYYIIQPGDTLSDIAQKTLGDWRQWSRIVEYNNMKPPFSIHAGQELKIPGP